MEEFEALLLYVSLSGCLVFMIILIYFIYCKQCLVEDKNKKEMTVTSLCSLFMWTASCCGCCGSSSVKTDLEKKNSDIENKGDETKTIKHDDAGEHIPLRSNQSDIEQCRSLKILKRQQNFKHRYSGTDFDVIDLLEDRCGSTSSSLGGNMTSFDSSKNDVTSLSSRFQKSRWVAVLFYKD